jgi:hypothetical protein
MILEPWPHIITQDYISEEFLQSLIKYSKDKTDNFEVGRFLFEEYNFPQELNEQYAIYKETILNEFNRLKNVFPKHRVFNSNINTRLRTTLCIIPENYTHEIHDERIDKIMSFVTYIAPTQGIGTHIYNTDKSYNKTIEWKVGSTLVFCGFKEETWHSFESGSNYRVTLNSFIDNTDLTSVFKQVTSLTKPGDNVFW